MDCTDKELTVDNIKECTTTKPYRFYRYNRKISFKIFLEQDFSMVSMSFCNQFICHRSGGLVNIVIKRVIISMPKNKNDI